MNFVPIIFALFVSDLLQPISCHQEQKFYGGDSPNRPPWNQWAARDHPVALNDILQLLFASNFPTAVASNISAQCVEDSRRYVSALADTQSEWALMMYESTGQFPEGYVGGGNVHAVGLFDECLSVRSSMDNAEITGQYCTVFFHVEPISSTDQVDDLEEETERAENWLLLYQLYRKLYNESVPLKTPKVRETDVNSRFLPSVGLCLPSSCSVQDVRSACAQQVGMATVRENVSVVTITDDHYCYTEAKIKDSPVFDAADIVVIFILCLFGLLIIVATSYEAWKPINTEPDGLAVRSLGCFSILRNAKTILNTKKTNNADNFSCLNGIRVLTTTWVIIGHLWRWHVTRSNQIYNRNQLYEDLFNDWTMQPMNYLQFCVDTFFLMSGMLAAGSLLRELDRNNGRFNVFFYYLHRYIRLTAVYAIILGFIATLLAHLGTGPDWRNAETMSESCRSDWWQNLLYINNYYIADTDSANNMCMGETWYLAADMQMFWLSPLFIYPLWRWKRAGLGWILFSASLLVAAGIVVYVVWELPPSFNLPFAPQRNVLYDTKYYSETWVHFPSYLIGILLGLLLHRTKNYNITLTKLQVVSGWILATAMGLAVMYGMAPYTNDVSIPDGIRIAYGSLHRVAWSVAVSWVIFACTRGYGGYVNKFLSWNAFTVLGRLTYVVYLTHYNFLAVYYAHARKPYYYTVLDRVVFYLGVVFISFLLAFLISITIELPLLNLEKIYIVHSPNLKGERKKSAPRNQPA